MIATAQVSQMPGISRSASSSAPSSHGALPQVATAPCRRLVRGRLAAEGKTPVVRVGADRLALESQSLTVVHGDSSLPNTTRSSIATRRSRSTNARLFFSLRCLMQSTASWTSWLSICSPQTEQTVMLFGLTIFEPSLPVLMNVAEAAKNTGDARSVHPDAS